MGEHGISTVEYSGGAKGAREPGSRIDPKEGEAEPQTGGAAPKIKSERGARGWKTATKKRGERERDSTKSSLVL